MVNQAAVTRTNMKLFARNVVRTIDDEFVDLPNATRREQAPIDIESRIVRQAKHALTAETRSAIANVTVAARVVVQRDHRVADKAKPLRVGVVVRRATKNVFAKLIGARGKTHRE